LLLTSPSWQLEVRPERGGRITSLRLGGEELLEQGIGIDDPDAADFVAGGAQGWDELVPNLEAVGSLPDHGEAWRVPWVVEEASDSSISMSCRGRAVPFELRRRIEVGRQVRVDYTYLNLGAEPHLAYWCGHPLFKFEDGMEIGVPGGEKLGALAWGASTKTFLTKGSIDRARLGWRSGAAIELGWDAGLTPYVGVWVCNGDLGGYRQIAIEPATGGNDRPDPAEPPPVLAPGETFEWWFEIRDARRLGRGVWRRGLGVDWVGAGSRN
jgi:galactose mutarotase-like enzyme